MGTAQTEVEGLSGIDLTDDEYQIEQALVRNKYKAYDSDGNLLFKGKQKAFKLKEKFPFVDPDGEELFTVSAEGILDTAGDYTLVDEQTGDPVVSLDREYTWFVDKWKIRHPKNEALIATIETESAAMEFVRSFVPYGGFVPHKYEISDVDDNLVGRIDGQFSMKDRYTITVEDTSDVPRDAVVASAMVIDAIEGN